MEEVKRLEGTWRTISVAERFVVGPRPVPFTGVYHHVRYVWQRITAAPSVVVSGRVASSRVEAERGRSVSFSRERQWRMKPV